MMDLGTHPRARTTGFVHLLYFLVGSAGSALTRGIVVSGDPAATVKNLLAHETLYRSGVEVGILANAVYIMLAALYFVLFEPVSRRVSLIAAFLGLAGCAVQLFGTVFQAAPLILLGGASSAGSIPMGSMPAAVRFSLKLYSETYNVSLVLFALFDLSIGWLVFKSGFLPRILGVAMMLAGLVAGTFLWPPFALAHLAVILSIGGVAELALMLWLIVKGVDDTKWRERRASPQ